MIKYFQPWQIAQINKSMINIFIVLYLFLVSTSINSQSINKSLFLLVDRKTDSIYENGKSSLRIRYRHFNEKQNWVLNLEHINIPNDKRNHFRYLLPKEMVKEFVRKGNVREIKLFMRELDTLRLKELGNYFKVRYLYFYEYLKKNQYKTQRRYNVFLFFKSDLEKEYIPFYEVSLTKFTTEEQ